MWRPHPSLSELRLADPDFKSRVDLTLNALVTSTPNDALKAAAEPSKLHRALFQPVMLWGYPAGKYRGAVGTPYERLNIEAAQERSNRLVTVMSDYWHVARDMKLWSSQVGNTNINQSPEGYYKRVVYLYFRFLEIHPFFDGNGHVSRLILFSLLHICPEIRVGKKVIHPTPFNKGLSYAIDGYRRYSDVLESYLMYTLSIQIGGIR